ncbi:MAG: hypothetical protein LBS55_06010 [Prevotellaceae bacterium]|jgi:hypothetical protein|nr:hypothetical protein [Prevotellaceae bacterium]
MEKFVPDIQEQMRKSGYPDFLEEQYSNIIIDHKGLQPPKIDLKKNGLSWIRLSKMVMC